MIKEDKFSYTGIKIAAVIISILLVLLVFSNYLPGIQRFYIMVLLAFIGLPAMWKLLRGEKSGDRDGTYPIKSDDRDEPITEIGVFGPSRTYEYSTMPKDPENWVNPYVDTFIERLKKRKKAAVKKIKEQEKAKGDLDSQTNKI